MLTGQEPSLKQPQPISTTAGTLTLLSGSGAIGTSGANILTNAPNLVANTSGNVYVSDSAAATLREHRRVQYLM